MNSETRNWAFGYIQKSRGLSVYDRLREIEQLADLSYDDQMHLQKVVLDDSVYSKNVPLVLARSGIQRRTLSETLIEVTPKSQRDDKPLRTSKSNGHPQELLRGLVLTLGECSIIRLRDRAKYVDRVISEVFPLDD